MKPRADTDDYRELFLSDTRLMDTRAPVEFQQGAFPNASNLPLMSDEERHLVGIRYKEAGQQGAIELGEQLVAGAERAQRMENWVQFARENPGGYLYCFRGGLRSQTVQRWLAEAGVEYPLVLGGYKAMRRFLIDELARNLAQIPLLLIAGKTGTGKTRVISAIENHIDLEGTAHHRGSAFGDLLEAQPCQVDFENMLAIDFMKLAAVTAGPIVLEDEGRLIGRLVLPDVLQDSMRVAPILVLEESVAFRTDVVLEDYVLDLGRRFSQVHGADGSLRHEEKLVSDLLRIKKRLGGERCTEVEQQMRQAFTEQRNNGSVVLHRAWIETLLVDYYDPMYEYQLGKRQGKVLARGSGEEMIERAQQLADRR